MHTTRPTNFRLLTLLRKRPFTTLPSGPSLPSSIPVDEEISPVYNSKYFYPAKPGEILASRYQPLVKVGWGVSSTVWLARDLEGHIEAPDKIVALKIANSNARLAWHEREVEERIASTNPSHRGRSLIRTFIDSFEIQNTDDTYSCLVYTPMRETLSMYQRRFEGGKMPLALVKAYIRVLLTGLDYLHKECRIVHTDLKLDNIMVSIEDPAVLSNFMESQLDNPMAFKIDSIGRPVYQSCSDFGPLKSLSSMPQLVDFGLATRLAEDDDWGVWPIQPDHYRAPEVILGNGWQTEADIWNLGVLMWDMIEGGELFQHIHDQDGCYDPKRHVAEMIGLLGPPPPEIIERYHDMRNYSWPQPVQLEREDGTTCGTAEEYFCGPFFDSEGRSLYENMIPDRKLEDTVSFFQGEEKDSFLHLAKQMLTWHPNYRKTAGELAEHPFLQLKGTSG